MAKINKTKKKIIEAAVKLFNKEGISNVRNQDIAKAAGISLSNFNYHFKTKKDLVLAVITYMVQILEERVYGNQILIRDGKGLDITKAYFEFERDFRFFYFDTYNILHTYAEIKEEMQTQIQSAIQIIKNLNYLAIGMGLMKPEPAEMPGLYNRLAEQIWINNHFWFTQMSIRGKTENLIEEGLYANYTIVYPYLTNKGKMAYQMFIDSQKKKA